jgi:hypothetical protein
VDKNIIKVFRSLVVLTLFLNIFWFAFPHFWYLVYSPEEVDLLLRDGEGGLLLNDSYVAYIYCVAYVVLSIGLLRLQYWAKIGFSCLMLLGLILSPFFGVSVLGGYDVLLSSIIGLSYGVILTLAFLVIRKPL